MGIVSAVVLAGGAAVWNTLGGDVIAEVASQRDGYGRCIDREVFLKNNSKNDASDLELSFEVDYFTRQGTVLLEYGDERQMLLSPVQRTLLPRQPYIPVASSFDQKVNVLSVASLKPGQYVHLHFGGETVVDSERASARERLFTSKDAQLMDKPRLISVVRKDGSITVRRIVECHTQ